MEGVRGIEQINRKTLGPRRIQHSIKFWDETVCVEKNTKTKMTALARSVDLEGGWTDVH